MGMGYGQRMSLGHSMQQRAELRQVLAPRMIQAMKILQLPLVELLERIDQEMIENPVLDIQERDPDLPDEAFEYEPDGTPPEQKELVVDEKHQEDDFDRLVSLSEEWDDHFDADRRISSNRVEEEGERKHDAMANAVSRPQSLQDYLRDQLVWYDLDPALRAMTERIIYNLDHDGYLQGNLQDLLDPEAGPEDLTLAEKALQMVQRLDPPGVGARNLRECLLLQLTPDMEHVEALRAIIANHLEDVRDNRLPLIQKKTGYSIDVIQSALDTLRHLKPKPGGAFSDEAPHAVVPDVFVERGEDGQYRVRLEDTQTPNLYISPYYRKLLKQGASDAKTRDYIKDKINSAQWLIESIEQRRSTMQRVAQAIVDHQTSFLEQGPESIEPLKMQQIADKVGVHVTTVSRAVDGKWIQTPRGIFPLKRFFGGGTVSASGEEIAWDAVRIKLNEIIGKEDKSNPYSDEDLVDELGKHGLTVARRTVTKYRKAMNIPSSRQRRDWSLGNGKKNGKVENGHHDDHDEDADE
jgi:RNA polymerase sigma-54 factor